MTERGFDLGIGRELAALGLRKPFQHGGKMRRIDLLWLSLMAAEGQHGERNFILAVRRQAPHGFQGFFEQFCHERKIRSSRPKWKGVRQPPDLQRLRLACIDIPSSDCFTILLNLLYYSLNNVGFLPIFMSGFCKEDRSCLASTHCAKR